VFFHGGLMMGIFLGKKRKMASLTNPKNGMIYVHQRIFHFLQAGWLIGHD
jgi:hypothetical protein